MASPMKYIIPFLVGSLLSFSVYSQPTNQELADAICTHHSAHSFCVTDTDGDGVADGDDLCSGTPTGEPVDSNGCSASQLDDDGDGVTNDKDLCPNTVSGAEVDADGCEIDDTTTTGYTWVEVPNSSQDTVFIQSVDEDPYVAIGEAQSWQNMQTAWGGGTCMNGKLYIMGGGHGDGAHNGMLAVDADTGQWERVVEPGPVPPNSNDQASIDGKPVSRHTYNLLTNDGEDVYLFGGAIYETGGLGSSGHANFRYDMSASQWVKISDGLRESQGNAIVVDGTVYLIGNGSWGDMHTYDLAGDTWTKVGKNNVLSQMSPQATMAYEPNNDVFVIIGKKQARMVSRSNFGTEWIDISAGAPTEALNPYHPGVTAKDGIVYVWNGGQTVYTFDPATKAWETHIVDGVDPGSMVGAGTLSKFNNCGGQIILLNGHNKNMYQLSFSEAPVEEEPADSEPSPGPVTENGIIKYPYYATPPVDIAERICGPESEWNQVDLYSDADKAKVDAYRDDDNVLVRVHWKPEPYSGMPGKNKQCIKFVGIDGPTGEKPTVRNISASKWSKYGPSKGGLIVENLRVSPSDYMKATGEMSGGDCIGTPNDKQFMIIRDSVISGCQHHAFITAHAYHMYLEIDNSHFEYAQSHLAYIDTVAMAYVHDSTFQSPGWGHALRCIAARCIIENVEVSNIELDGTIAPDGVNAVQPTRQYIGMQPLEIYNCGGEHIVNNVTVKRYADGSGSFGVAYRDRNDKNGCDLGDHNDIEWTYAPYGTDAWLEAQDIPVEITFKDMTIDCLSGKCYGFDLSTLYPMMDSGEKAEMQKWIRAGNFTDWEAMMAAAPEKWKWTFSRTYDDRKDTLLGGGSINAIPLWVPEGWTERSHAIIDNVSIINSIDMIRPSNPNPMYCMGYWDVEGKVCKTPDRHGTYTIK